MSDFYDTEAGHLSEIYDDYGSFSEPYSSNERRDYILAKGYCFRKEDVGKYVIVQNSRRNKKVMPTMYLVDRTLTKRMWWSPASYYAMIFNSKSAAEYQVKRYRYNKPRIMEIKPYMADIERFKEMYEE